MRVFDCRSVKASC